MPNDNSRRRKIPLLVWIGVTVGGGAGMFLGNALCIGYDVIYGPWGPQAGVDPQPAGWVGWWIAVGAVIGVLIGLVVAVVALGLWRLAGGSRRE